MQISITINETFDGEAALFQFAAKLQAVFQLPFDQLVSAAHRAQAVSNPSTARTHSGAGARPAESHAVEGIPSVSASTPSPTPNVKADNAPARETLPSRAGVEFSNTGAGVASPVAEGAPFGVSPPELSAPSAPIPAGPPADTAPRSRRGRKSNAEKAAEAAAAGSVPSVPPPELPKAATGGAAATSPPAVVFAAAIKEGEAEADIEHAFRQKTVNYLIRNQAEFSKLMRKYGVSKANQIPHDKREAFLAECAASIDVTPTKPKLENASDAATAGDGVDAADGFF